MKFGIRLRNSIFKGSRRPRKGKFKVVISYPGQFINARVMKYIWKAMSRNTEHTMEFNIQNMVVHKKRNKGHKTCHKGWKYDDDYKLNALIKKIGCEPDQLSRNTTFPKCSSMKEPRGINYADIEKINAPCRQVEKILYSYDEYLNYFTKDTKNNTIFELSLNFQGETYMEIEQARAYDLERLIGNAGGYIGVFLGVALIQLPSFILHMHNYAQLWYKHK